MTQDTEPTTPTQDTAPGWCCYDCLALLANGETVTLGRMLGQDDCQCEDWDTDTHRQCEEMEFSWRRCDVCRSTLGGSRHAVTFWLPAA